MKKVLILGCNGITEYIVPKLLEVPAVEEIIIASRDKAECDEFKKQYSGGKTRITTARVDLDNEQGTRMMLSIVNPDLIVNLIPEKFSLTVMKLALENDADYIDGNLYNWRDGDLLAEQFSLFEQFREKNKAAITGCCTDPAILTSIARQAARDDFDSVDSAEFYEINLIEDLDVKSDAVYITGGKQASCPALSEKISAGDSFEPFAGMNLFLSDRPVVRDYIKEIPGITEVRCYVSCDVTELPDYTEELNKIGMLSDEPVEILPGVTLSPRRFWELYQNQKTAAAGKSLGRVCGAGVTLTGTKSGSALREFIYFTGDNKKSQDDYKMPAMKLFDACAILAGIKLMIAGKWLKNGVFTPTAFDPDMLIRELRSADIEIKHAVLSDASAES